MELRLDISKSFLMKGLSGSEGAAQGGGGVTIPRGVQGMAEDMICDSLGGMAGPNDPGGFFQP